jgi:hypothetical protein
MTTRITIIMVILSEAIDQATTITTPRLNTTTRTSLEVITTRLEATADLLTITTIASTVRLTRVLTSMTHRSTLKMNLTYTISLKKLASTKT